MSATKFIDQMKELVSRSDGKMILITPLALDLLAEIAAAAHGFEQTLNSSDLKLIGVAEGRLMGSLRRASAAQLDADTKLVVFPDA